MNNASVLDYLIRIKTIATEQTERPMWRKFPGPKPPGPVGKTCSTLKLELLHDLNRFRSIMESAMTKSKLIIYFTQPAVHDTVSMNTLLPKLHALGELRMADSNVYTMVTEANPNKIFETILRAFPERHAFSVSEVGAVAYSGDKQFSWAMSSLDAIV